MQPPFVHTLRTLSFAIAMSASTLALADDSHRGDAHAPAGVMGDHAHNKGEFMLSYRAMSMPMANNLDGTDSIALNEILGGMVGTGDYMVAAEEMNMTMHMLGAMYAPSDSLTLMLMTHYISMDMDHATAMGGAFNTTSDGLGDTSITGLYKLTESSNSTLLLNLGISVPTGSIDQSDVTPASTPDEATLPYPMQLGSGTYDLIPGLTYSLIEDSWSYGWQVKGTVRTGENDANYRLGNRAMATAWYARPFANHLSWSARVAAETWGDIKGADARLNAAMVATADPDLRAGTRADFGLGLNWIMPLSNGNQWRLSGELTTPVYQNLNGPQLELEHSLVLSSQYSF